MPLRFIHSFNAVQKGVSNAVFINTNYVPDGNVPSASRRQSVTIEDNLDILEIQEIALQK